MLYYPFCFETSMVLTYFLSKDLGWKDEQDVLFSLLELVNYNDTVIHFLFSMCIVRLKYEYFVLPISHTYGSCRLPSGQKFSTQI